MCACAGLSSDARLGIYGCGVCVIDGDHESGWIIEGVILRRHISTEIYPSEVLEGGVLIVTTIAESLLISRREQRRLAAVGAGV